MTEIEVIGHRGCKGLAPENTLLAFRKAIELKVDAIELDVRLTKDKKLVVIHDDSLERTTNGKGLVSKKTLKELKELDAGNGQKIPELDEVLKLCKGKTKIHIELKEDTVDKVLSLIKKRKLNDSVVIISFNSSFLEKVKKEMPEIETGLIFAQKPLNLLQQIKEAKVNAIHPLTAITNKALVEFAHKNNLKIRPWTANNPKEMYRLKALNVDGIYTDYPDRLIKVLRK